MIRRIAAGLTLLAIAPAAAAQSADSLLTGVRTTLSAEMPDQALERLRRSLTEHPDDAGLLAEKLRLERGGVGMAGVPPLAERAQQMRTARRLVAVDPSNALGNLVVGLDDLETFEFFRDRVSIPFTFSNTDEALVFRTSGLTPQYLKNRFLRGRFNTDLLTDAFMSLDASGPGRGKDASARQHLEAAIAVDPALRDAYEPLATLAAMLGLWPDVAAISARAQAQFPEWGSPLLWHALVEYRTGRAAAADATFAHALALLPRADRFRYEDLTALLTPADAERYHAGPEAFAQAFWAREDSRLLTPANERRAEHYARRTEADLLFGWSGAEGAATPRGRTWARYGAPPTRTRFSGNMYSEGEFMPRIPYEVWEYEGFRMVFQDPDRSGAYYTFVPPSSALSSYDPFLQSTAVSDDYIAVDKRLQREAPEASTYAPARRERVPFLATAFRGGGGRAEVVVAFGVPLAARPAAGTSARIAVETGVFALRDGQPLPVAERRHEQAALTASETIPLGGAAVWVGAETLLLAPGVYTVAAEFSAPNDVAGFERGPLAVPTFLGQGLELSGLLLAASADEGAPGPVQRRGVGIVPMPLDAVSGRVSVYAEAYGLILNRGRSDYEVELALVPEDGRGTLGRIFGRSRRGGVSTASEAQGASVDEAIVLSLDVSGQAAGAYTLALRVTDRVARLTAETSRRVTVE